MRRSEPLSAAQLKLANGSFTEADSSTACKPLCLKAIDFGCQPDSCLAVENRSQCHSLCSLSHPLVPPLRKATSRCHSVDRSVD